MRIISFLIVVASIAGCNQKKPIEASVEQGEDHHGESVSLTREQFKRIGIEIGKIEEKNLREIVRANGFLKVPPQNQADVSVPIGGMVDAILVREGDFVKKSDTLAMLRHPNYVKLQEDFISSKNKLALLESEFQRLKQLKEQKLESEQNYLSKESDHLSEKARKTSLGLQLEMLQISTRDLENGRIVSAVPLISPISGYIAHIAATIGMFAEVTQTLFRIVDNSHIHVDLLVYEKDLFKIKTGQTVHFVLTNQANLEIDGFVFSIGKAFENETKSVAVHADIKDGNKYGLIPGMFVNALIDVGSQKTACVPSESIVDMDGKRYIFLLTEDNDLECHFDMTEVSTGISDLGFTEITPIKDIPMESRLVTHGAFFLLSKMKTSEENEEHGH